MTSRKPPCTHFGSEVSTLLASASITQSDLARAIGKHPNHLNSTLRAYYAKPTASWADLVANALDLPDEGRRRLHLAAARDQGFKL